MVKLWLGTAQFGLDYGVSNATGQIGQTAAAAILDLAYSCGIETLDTAPAYGGSEALLGALDAARRFRIITKTPQFRSEEITAAAEAAVERSLDTSLQKLGTARVDGLLVHWPGDLLAPGSDHVYRALASAKADGRVERIGVSVYDPGELTGVLDRYEIDFAQIPLNLFDQRFIRSGTLARCRAAGVSVHSRSAFLQGLLLLHPDELPPRVAHARPNLLTFRSALSASRLTPLEACLDFVANEPGLEAVVCGVAGLRELEQIAAALAARREERFSASHLSVDNPRVIDPRLW